MPQCRPPTGGSDFSKFFLYGWNATDSRNGVIYKIKDKSELEPEAPQSVLSFYNEERQKLQNCLKIVVTLSAIHGLPSFVELTRNFTQAELSDMYFAYLESLSVLSNGHFKDVEVKSHTVRAGEMGFTPTNLDTIDDLMSTGRAKDKRKNR